MTRQEGLQILLDAAQSPRGLLLSTTNVQGAVNALERIRKAEQNPGLAELVFRKVDYSDGNLLIVKGPRQEPQEPRLPPELKGLQDL